MNIDHFAWFVLLLLAPFSVFLMSISLVIGVSLFVVFLFIGISLLVWNGLQKQTVIERKVTFLALGFRGV